MPRNCASGDTTDCILRPPQQLHAHHAHHAHHRHTPESYPDYATGAPLHAPMRAGAAHVRCLSLRVNSKRAIAAAANVLWVLAAVVVGYLVGSCMVSAVHAACCCMASAVACCMVSVACCMVSVACCFTLQVAWCPLQSRFPQRTVNGPLTDSLTGNGRIPPLAR